MNQPAQARPDTRQIEYKSRKEMDAGMRSMTGRNGYRVAAVTELERRRGILARLMWLPWLGHKKPHYLVTYEAR
jgi:hypothetical protein